MTHPDEKSQKEAVDERKIFTRSSPFPPTPSPPPLHVSEYAYMKQQKAEKDKKQPREDDIRKRETTKGNFSVDAGGQAKGQINEPRGRHHYTQRGGN